MTVVKTGTLDPEVRQAVNKFLVRGYALVALIMAMAGILGCTGCGSGGNPTGPTSTPTPAPLEIRDGWTEQKITANLVSNPAPRLNERLHVETEGYLPRDTTFTGAPVYLWPATQGYVGAVVYGTTSAGRLGRWTENTITIGLGGLQGDADVLAVAQEAATEIQVATGEAVTVGAVGAVTVAVDPGDAGFSGFPNVVALSYVTLSGSRIVGARSVFRGRAYIVGASPSHLQNTFLHEMGHALGLSHSPDLSDVMERGSDARTQERHYSTNERIALKMMYRWRQPGNTAPDYDAGLTTSSLSAEPSSLRVVLLR